VVLARLAMARAGLPGVAVAEGSSLGRAVAGTVSRRWFAASLVGCLAAACGTAWAVDGPGTAVRLAAAAASGILAAEVLHRRASARLGGTTGDVMGASGEVAVTAHLLVAAALWP
jgi:adenosylcobinamide-GDP ribazoletransferase